MKKLSDKEKIERMVKIMTDYFNVNNKVKGDYADWDDNVIIYTFKFVFIVNDDTLDKLELIFKFFNSREFILK